MTRRIQKLFNLINSKLPSYNSAFLKVRGVAIPLDLFLRGYIRFGRKLGGVLPIWIPHNTTELAKSASVVDDTLEFTEALSWMVTGSRIRLADKFIMQIDDLLDDGLTATLTDTLFTDLDAGATVELYANPLEVVGTFPNPVTTFVVKSDYKIYKGDSIVYELFEFPVESVTFVSTLSDGRYEYQITIGDGGINDTIHDGSTTEVYLRAYPAYESSSLVLPYIPNTISSEIGPFLFDRVSGTFYTDLDVEEIDLISTYDQSGNLLATYDGSKNFLFYRVNIPADSFLFWDKLRGSINWMKDTQSFRAVSDSEGKFHLKYKCVPIIEPGQITSWQIKVTPVVTTRMVVELEPNAGQSFDLTAGVQNTVTVSFPSTSDPIEYIHLLFDTTYGEQEILMKDWGLDTTAVKSISHVTIAKAAGRTWASSSAYAKPLWFRLAYLNSRTDLQSSLDGGLLVT